MNNIVQLIFGLGERCKLPQWGPGEAPAAVDFGAFWTSQNTFGNNYLAPKQVRLVAAVSSLNFWGDNATGVPPTQTLGEGRVPPIPNGLTPLATTM